MILQIPETENTVILLLGAGIAVILLIMAVYLLKRKSRQETITRIRDTPQRPRSRLDYHSDSPMKKKLRRSVQSAGKQTVPQPAAASSPDETADLTTGKKTITESFAALAAKYAVEGITLAAPDGLVFASSGREDAAADAALYSDRFFQDPLTETPGFILTGLSFEGQDLVGIIRSEKSIPDPVVKKIVSDTKDILNWWI